MTAPGAARLPGLSRETVLPPVATTVASAVPVFIGAARSGPRYTPIALARLDAFEGTFGARADAMAVGHLGDAVAGFYANQGGPCYVVGVGPDGDWLDRALQAAQGLDDVDLVVAPDLATLPADQRVAGQRRLLEDCAALGTRFTLLDVAPDGSIDGARLQGPAGRFGAVYGPWLVLADGRAVPASGHVAGLYARSDAAFGPGTAPANQELLGVVDLAIGDASALFAAGVNPARALPHRGIRVWGARTLADQPDWSQVNVSRLFIAVARWLRAFSGQFVFAPNDLELWVRIRRELSDWLWQRWREGALAGATPEAAFFVKCDGDTNPPDVRALGLVVTEVGLAPVTPAEFISVRLVEQRPGAGP